MNWSFSINELYLLGGILQVPGFIGLDDPFPGYLTEEIQEYMGVAHQSLIDQGYLEETEDGFLIDSDLIKAIQFISTSPQVVTAAFNGVAIFIHLGTDMILEQESKPDGRIAISVHESSELARQRLLSLLSLPDMSAASGPSFTIDPGIMEEARGLITIDDTFSTCKNFLINNSVPAASADPLVQTLSRPISTGSLILLQRKGLSLEPLTNLAWVFGDKGGWVIKLPVENTSSTISWEPASSAAISKSIENILAMLLN